MNPLLGTLADLNGVGITGVCLGIGIASVAVGLVALSRQVLRDATV
jgi:ABC-type Co2+ transport system permease subunit